MHWVGKALATFALGAGILLAAAPGSPASGPEPVRAPVPRPPPFSAIRPTDHRDPVSRRAFRSHLARGLPAGTWRALGPAPVGPPFLYRGGSFGGVAAGRVTSVLVIESGSHAGRVVIGSAGGGIWTSDNGGKTWTARTDSAPDLAIGAVAIDPNNPNHLLAGTGEANQSGDSYRGSGMLSSFDGGSTWTATDPGDVFYGQAVAQIAFDPRNSKHVFAATTAGLYVTTNGGASWAKPAGPSYNSVDGNLNAVVLDASTNPTTVYVGGGPDTVAKSVDGGLTWAAANSGIVRGGDLTALALAPSDRSTLYVSVGSATNPVSLYKSVNSAASWTPLTTAPDYTGAALAYGHGSSEQGNYDNVVAVDPTNPNHVLAGGIQLVETIDGGSTWTTPNGAMSYNARAHDPLHPDNHALFFAPGGTVWVGDDGGIYHYSPATKAVTDSNGNLDITQVRFGLSVVDGSILVGLQDNASAETSASVLSPWAGIWTGDGGPSAITPGDTSLQFTSLGGELYRTTDVWHTLSEVSPTATRPFTPPLLLIPNRSQPRDPTVLFGGRDVWRTTNPSATTPTWTRATSVGTGTCGFYDTCVSALAAAPSNPKVVYAGFSNGTVQVSTNGGASFSPTKVPTPSSSYDRFITGISVDPSHPDAITVSFSYATTRTFLGYPHVQQYVWSGSPASGTWTVITGSGLPSAVSRVVYYEGALLAATDSGVYATRSPAGSSTTWSRVGSGLPSVQTQDLEATSDGLYAATFGRGVWLLPTGAPLNLRVPTITQRAGKLTEDHGIWTGRPTAYRYQWLRCNSTGYTCLAIAGATGSTHTLAAADKGHEIRVQETAGNAHGFATGPASAPTGVIPSG